MVSLGSGARDLQAWCLANWTPSGMFCLSRGCGPALNSLELCTDSDRIPDIFSTVTDSSKDKGRRSVMAGQVQEVKARDVVLSRRWEGKREAVPRKINHTSQVWGIRPKSGYGAWYERRQAAQDGNYDQRPGAMCRQPCNMAEGFMATWTRDGRTLVLSVYSVGVGIYLKSWAGTWHDLICLFEFHCSVSVIDWRRIRLKVPRTCGNKKWQRCKWLPQNWVMFERYAGSRTHRNW